MNKLPPQEKSPSGWVQPSADDIEIDDTHALMTEETFNQLRVRHRVNPIDFWVGKLWRTFWRDTWYLSWYASSDKFGQCTGNHREILII